MDTDKVNVAVHRELLERAEDIDLTAFLDSVYEAVVLNFSLFGADEKWHVNPVEVRLDVAIIYNYMKRFYYRAKITMDTEGNVSLSDIVRVKIQWVPLTETVERSEDGELQVDFVSIEMRARKGFWGAVL